jgi:undecaprenyl-diphosphatase
MSSDEIHPGLLLLGAGLGAAAGFAALARGVATRRTRSLDARARKQFPKRRRKHTKRAANAFGPIGKEYVHLPIALATSAYVYRRTEHPLAAAAIMLSSASSTTASRVFERLLWHRRPPPGRRQPSERSFPSGHSLETTAVTLTMAYIAAREGLVSPLIAAPVAIAVPLISGLGRLYLDRHWTTDVAGGWLAGLAIASWCGAVYETSKSE